MNSRDCGSSRLSITYLLNYLLVPILLPIRLHQLAQHIRRIGAGRERTFEHQCPVLDRPCNIGRLDAERSSFPTKSALAAGTLERLGRLSRLLDDLPFDVARLAGRPRGTRPEQDAGRADFKRRGARLFDFGLLDVKAGAVRVFHRPIPRHHAIQALNPCGDDLIEQERLVRVEEPEPLRATHPPTATGISK